MASRRKRKGPFSRLTGPPDEDGEPAWAKRLRGDSAAKVRHLLAIDAKNVMVRLNSRQDAMVALFSRLRDRGPLMTATHTWFATAGFDNLALLEPHEQVAASTFYELLSELRWYLQYTEDMPLQLRVSLEQFVRRLDESHRALLATLGPPDERGAPVVDAEVVSRRRRR